MSMNILQQEDLIKGAPDDLLIQEAKAPTGQVPQYLVISEIQRRKDMRERFASQEEQPSQTVADQIVAGASPPQGIGALQPQMSPQMPTEAPMGAMPPSGGMPPPQIPPEMMAAQAAPMAPPPQMMAAGGGMMPYRRMAGGGMIPPNALVEDQSKFSIDSAGDIPEDQRGMVSPVNMGLPKVVSNDDGSDRRLFGEKFKKVFSNITANLGGFQGDQDSLSGRGSLTFPMGENSLNLGMTGRFSPLSGDAGIAGLDATFSVPDENRSYNAFLNPDERAVGFGVQQSFNDGGVVRMQEGESVPYEIPLSFGRTVSSEDVPEWYRKKHETGREEMRALENRFTDEEGNIDKAGLSKYLGARGLESGIATLTPGVFFKKPLMSLAGRVAPKVSGGFKHVEKIIKEGLLPKKVFDIVANFFKNNPQILPRAGVAGLAGYPIYERYSNTGDVIRQVEAEQRREDPGREDPGREDPGRQEVIDLILQHTAGKSSGGVVKMKSGRTVEPGMSDEEIVLALNEMARLGVAIPPEMDVSRWIDPDSAGETASSNFVSDVVLGEADITDPALGRSVFGSVKEPEVAPVVPEVAPVAPEVVDSVGGKQNYSQSLIDMITERSRNIESLLGRQKELPSPDYEALKASLTEGVDDDATASILMSIGKSIAEGKGLAGADISQAQAIRQKAKDAMNALTLAESRGASEREIAAFDRELNTQLALLSSIPSPPNPMTGMTQLQKLHYYRDTLDEGEDREAVKNLIARMTDQSIQDILAELVVLQGGIESYDPETGKFTTVTGMEALDPGQQAQWNAAKNIGALDQFINERVAASLGTP
jgi:hypothetical protein